MATGPRTEDDLRERRRQALRSLLLAVMIFGALVGGLFAYARTWPPMVAVESVSMQHALDTSYVGVIDTGDLVLVQAVGTRAEVVTYLEGRATGHSTYGDYGDVIVFVDPTAVDGDAYIHRAMAHVTWNQSAGAYDVPDLERLPVSEWDAWDASGTPTEVPFGVSRFLLRSAGWAHDLVVNFNLSDGERAIAVNQGQDGFLTMGDLNAYTTITKFDLWIIPLPLVVGKARGEIPWFGLVKLTLFRQASGCCEYWGSTSLDAGAPANSWLALNVSLAILVAIPVGLTIFDLYLRRHPEARQRLEAFRRRIWPWSGKREGPGSEGENQDPRG